MASLERTEVARYVFARNSPFSFRRGRHGVGLLDLLCDPEKKDVILKQGPRSSPKWRYSGIESAKICRIHPPHSLQ